MANAFLRHRRWKKFFFRFLFTRIRWPLTANSPPKIQKSRRIRKRNLKDSTSSIGIKIEDSHRTINCFHIIANARKMRPKDSMKKSTSWGISVNKIAMSTLEQNIKKKFVRKVQLGENSMATLASKQTNSSVSTKATEKWSKRRRKLLRRETDSTKNGTKPFETVCVFGKFLCRYNRHISIT